MICIYWSVIKSIINKHQKSNIQCKLKLTIDTVTDGKKVVSESFNIFFITIGQTLAKSIPFTDKSPSSSMGNTIKESLYLQYVTCEEINNTCILVNLTNTACGWDDISSVFLKLSTRSIVQPLSYICNLSLTECVFPNQLRWPMLSHCTSLKMPCCLIIIDLCHCFVFCLKSLRKTMYSQLLDFCHVCFG